MNASTYSLAVLAACTVLFLASFDISACRRPSETLCLFEKKNWHSPIPLAGLGMRVIPLTAKEQPASN